MDLGRTVVNFDANAIFVAIPMIHIAFMMLFEDRLQIVKFIVVVHIVH